MLQLVMTRHRELRVAAPVARQVFFLLSTFSKTVSFYQVVWTKEKQAHSDYLFALWVAGSYLPITMSKDPGAHRFLASLNSHVRSLKLNLLYI